MEKKFVVKDFQKQTYFQGWDFGWEGRNEGDYATPHWFDSLEDTELFISRQDGQFVIETIYIP